MGVEQDLRDFSPNSRHSMVGSGMSDLDLADTSAKSKGIDISPVIRVIQRNLPLIAIIALGVTGVAAYLGKQSPRSYQGSFRILVEPITSQARSTDPSALSRDRVPDANNVDYPTLLEVLQSPEILSKVAAQIQSRDPSLKVTSDALLAEITRKNLVVKRIGEDMLNSTRLVEVSYKGRSPEQVQIILDELAKGYLRYSLEDRRTRIGGGIEFIEDQLPSLQKRVNSLEGALQDLKQRYRLTDPETEGSGITQQLQETRSQRLQTQRELAEQQALYARLQNQLGLTPEEAMVAASISENTRLQELVAELKKVEAQTAIKAARFNEASPVLQSLLDQRKNLAQLIEVEVRRNLGSNGARYAADSRILSFQNPLRLDLIKQLVTTANNRQLLEIRSRAVLQTEAALDQRLQQFPAIVRQYNDLQQQLEIATKTLNQFLTQRETLRIEAAQKEVPWEVVAPPELAKDLKGEPLPSPSTAPRMMLMGLVGGLLLGFLAAFFKEKLKNTFLSSEDAQGALQLPALGHIPHKRAINQAIEPLTTGSKDKFVKAFSSLYTNLRFLNATPVRSVILGSSSHGDGKTTTAVNLALAAAAMGQRVLLVDANLRLPEIHAWVDLPNARGLNELLSDEKLGWEDVIQRSTFDRNLFVLTAGEVSLNSARLLASNEMQNLMRQLQTAFDLVIYDTPNLTEYSDANFLATHSDGIVMVVGIGTTKRPAIQNAISELKKFRLPILGLVTNSPGKGSAAFQKNYQYEKISEGQTPLLESIGVFKSTSSAQSDISR